MTGPDRSRARALAAAGLAQGDPTGWFDTLYLEAADGRAVVPWADLTPNPVAVQALGAVPLVPGGRAMVVGCGYGDDAAHLARLGWAVTAFDLSPAAVREAARRFSELPTPLTWVVADVCRLPLRWRGAFDLVLEVYTVQVLPPGSTERRTAVDAIASLVAPGGRLVVVARAREEHEPNGPFPWPLSRAEVAPFGGGMHTERLTLETDPSEEPPVGRWVGVFRRPA